MYRPRLRAQRALRRPIRSRCRRCTSPSSLRHAPLPPGGSRPVHTVCPRRPCVSRSGPPPSAP